MCGAMEFDPFKPDGNTNTSAETVDGSRNLLRSEPTVPRARSSVLYDSRDETEELYQKLDRVEMEAPPLEGVESDEWHPGMGQRRRTDGLSREVTLGDFLTHGEGLRREYGIKYTPDLIRSTISDAANERIMDIGGKRTKISAMEAIQKMADLIVMQSTTVKAEPLLEYTEAVGSSAQFGEGFSAQFGGLRYWLFKDQPGRLEISGPSSNAKHRTQPMFAIDFPSRAAAPYDAYVLTAAIDSLELDDPEPLKRLVCKCNKLFLHGDTVLRRVRVRKALGVNLAVEILKQLMWTAFCDIDYGDEDATEVAVRDVCT